MNIFETKRFLDAIKSIFVVFKGLSFCENKKIHTNFEVWTKEGHPPDLVKHYLHQDQVYKEIDIKEQ